MRSFLGRSTTARDSLSRDYGDEDGDENGMARLKSHGGILDEDN